MNMTWTVFVFVALVSTCFASPYHLRSETDEVDSKPDFEKWIKAAKACLEAVKVKVEDERALEQLFGRSTEQDADVSTEKDEDVKVSDQCEMVFAMLAGKSCKRPSDGDKSEYKPKNDNEEKKPKDGDNESKQQEVEEERELLLRALLRLKK